jgi:ribonuclease HII
MAEMIERLEPDVAIVDAADVLSARFRCHIIELLSHPVQVISEHRADRNYPVVSAASIVAKVERDHHIDFLRNRFGDFGSGYMSDPKTKTFLEELAERCTTYPDFVRASWKPARIARANARMKQVKLA